MPGQVMVMPGKIFEPKVLIVQSVARRKRRLQASAWHAPANWAGVKGWLTVE